MNRAAANASVTLETGDMVLQAGQAVYLGMVVRNFHPVTPPRLPCRFVIRIMPLGDSITLGSSSTFLNGYRRPLDRYLHGAGVQFDFVGSLQDGEDDFDRDHEGHSGWHADIAGPESIARSVYGWLVQNPAAVVLLHAGTNDITQAGQKAGEAALILDEIDRFSPEITVILALIINESSYNPAVTGYNADLLRMARERIFTGDRIIIVNMENALNYPDDMGDLRHPDDGGYAKIATVWLEALMVYRQGCLLDSAGASADLRTAISP